MLERKIKEVLGNLLTLKAAWELYNFSHDKADCDCARNLETDCMVKLALLFPELGAIPDDIDRALFDVGIRAVPVAGIVGRIGFRFTRSDERVVVDTRTGEVERLEKSHTSGIVICGTHDDGSPSL